MSSTVLEQCPANELSPGRPVSSSNDLVLSVSRASRMDVRRAPVQRRQGRVGGAQQGAGNVESACRVEVPAELKVWAFGDVRRHMALLIEDALDALEMAIATSEHNGEAPSEAVIQRIMTLQYRIGRLTEHCDRLTQRATRNTECSELSVDSFASVSLQSDDRTALSGGEMQVSTQRLVVDVERKLSVQTSRTASWPTPADAPAEAPRARM